MEIIAQAEEKAKILLDEATVQHEAAMEKNRAEIAKEKENLIEAQKQVSEFKKSLFDMYKTHLEMISTMPEVELEKRIRLSIPNRPKRLKKNCRSRIRLQRQAFLQEL